MRSLRFIVIVYVVLLGGAVVLFLLVDAYGRNVVAPAASPPANPATVLKPQLLAQVLVALLAVLVVGRVLALLFRRVGQPAVLGEVLGGILLGPSLLGAVWPEAAAFVLPEEVAPTLGVIAQLGVILYMFLVGLSLDPAALRDKAPGAAVISLAGIVVPFSLGAALALVLFPRLAPAGVPFTGFALFLGVSLAITAFPVLARILRDRGMQSTPLGILATACAAADDVTAWCLLAFVVGVVQARVSGALLVLGLTALFILVVFVVVRPLARWLVAKVGAGPLSPGQVAFALGALLLSALATEAIGVHALFGAFLLGVVIPHDSAVARRLTLSLHDLVTVLLLPAFFAFTGMRTDIGLLAGVEAWLLCGLIVLVAVVGKFGGTLAAARLSGMPWREAAALGVLMNTRGLMELIALNIGLDLGIISRELFTMLVIMALATTLMTAPLLAWLVPAPRQPV